MCVNNCRSETDGESFFQPLQTYRLQSPLLIIDIAVDFVNVHKEQATRLVILISVVTRDGRRNRGQMIWDIAV